MYLGNTFGLRIFAVEYWKEEFERHYYHEGQDRNRNGS